MSVRRAVSHIALACCRKPIVFSLHVCTIPAVPRAAAPYRTLPLHAAGNQSYFLYTFARFRPKLGSTRADSASLTRIRLLTLRVKKKNTIQLERTQPGCWICRVMSELHYSAACRQWHNEPCNRVRKNGEWHCTLCRKYIMHTCYKVCIIKMYM